MLKRAFVHGFLEKQANIYTTLAGAGLGAGGGALYSLFEKEPNWLRNIGIGAGVGGVGGALYDELTKKPVKYVSEKVKTPTKNKAPNTAVSSLYPELKRLLSYDIVDLTKDDIQRVQKYLPHAQKMVDELGFKVEQLKEMRKRYLKPILNKDPSVGSREEDLAVVIIIDRLLKKLGVD